MTQTAGLGIAGRMRSCAVSSSRSCVSGVYLATVLIWLVARLTPAAAIVYVMPTDESMLSRSAVIVFGEVVAREPARSDGPVATDSIVRVEEVLKGSVFGTAIVVRQPGGVREDGVVSRIVGLPHLAVGDRVLLFLDRERGVYRTVELALGIFFEIDVGDQKLLVRDSSLQHELPLSSEPDAVERARSRLPRDAKRFRRWIAGRAVGNDPPVDYFDTDVPLGRAAVVLGFRHRRSGPNCDRPGHVFRWTNSDYGGTIEFALQQGGQPGIGGDGEFGRAEALAAMRAWSEDSGSLVDLVLRESPAKEPENVLIYLPNGENAFYFEDPFLIEAAGGTLLESGVLAVTLTHGLCTQLRLHQIPGNESVQAYELFEADIVTQDGYSEWLAGVDSPRRVHEEILAHSLGHALGIEDACGSEAAGACGNVSGGAIMRAFPHRDGRGATLNEDDLAALRFLYPAVEVADPVPDPVGPGEYTDCMPRTTKLVLDDNVEVSVCYATAEGVVGEGSAGLWASGQAGLLWFGDRANAEVLVKVLNGCLINGHRWVFVGAASDLAFNLEVRDSEGRTWTYRNPQGELASARDTTAFSCASGALQ